MVNRHIIALVALVAIFGMNAKGGLFDPSDEKRERAISDYLQHNPQVPMNLDIPLIELVDTGAFQTNGVRYVLDREKLRQFKIQLRFQSKELFGEQTLSRESKDISLGQSIADQYYLIDTNGLYVDLLIVLTTNSAFQMNLQRTVTINDYINSFILPGPDAEEITSHKYKSGWQNGTIFNQRVYRQVHSVRGFTFCENYSYTWGPRIQDYHGWPILNNIKIPDDRTYACYLLANNHRFLISLEFRDIHAEGLAKCQERAFEVLRGLNIEE